MLSAKKCISSIVLTTS
ncbi:Protein of unknown function [Bacillus mycoides]|nr:Protein of unknown function [Bacillus mycoides]